MTRSKRDSRPVAGPMPVSDRRKPRIMVAGEFSAGKTQLITGLLGERVLPSNVTPTSLPPIWLIGGNRALMAVGLDGVTRPIDSLDSVNVSETHFCILSHPAQFLERFDIIDTPGNSDPNIPSESWERMLGFADTVVWCTNATQAWRQSEKSVWKEMPPHLLTHATLLVTHADRMTDQRSTDRVFRRVQREAGAFFSSFLMASLIDPVDIDRITLHADALAQRLDTFPGADNQIVHDFRASDRVSGDPTVDKSAVKPRRIHRKKVQVPLPSVNDRPSAEVHLINLALAKAAQDAGMAEMPNGRAAAIWADLVRDVDISSPTALLACVGRMIGVLDGQIDGQIAVAETVTDDASADAPLIRNVMGRRKL